MKIVVNADIGAFRLSSEALSLYRTRGGRAADVEHDALTALARSSDFRTDPVLIGIVEELGPRASGPDSHLEVVEIEDGAGWRVFEVCGFETVLH